MATVSSDARSAPLPRSKRYVVDDAFAAQEFFHARGWTDGLPVVPPTQEAVQACLDWVLMPAGQLVGIEPVRQRAITAEKLAVNAVMAGCLPMHFPVVVAAFSAMLREPFLLHGATASTGGCAVLIVVNGAVRKELGMSGTFNALASSDRASSVIGRAIRLILCNLLDARPGEVDRSTLGHPGKFSYCVAEDEEHAAWLPLAKRLASLEGTTVAIVSNGKKGTQPFFAAFERELIERYGVARVVRLTKSNYSAPVEAELLNDAEHWHAIVAGVGD